MPHFAKDFGELPAHRRITVDKVPALSENLGNIIGRLKEWGIRVPFLGRMPAAHTLLQEIVARGTYPRDPDELRKTAEAIRLARDFGQIILGLGDGPSKVLATELQIATKGTLDGTGSDRRPQQFQSQFLIGAGLQLGGLNPEVPVSQARHPDFLVQPGVIRYAVEVKRPETRKGARSLLESARDQFYESDVHGVIVLDVTDCLEEMGINAVVRSSGSRAYEPFLEDFKAFAADLRTLYWIEAKAAHVPGWEALMGVFFLARGWRWTLGDLEAPEMFEMHLMHQVNSARGNLWNVLADGFFRDLVNGLHHAGGFINEMEHFSGYRLDRPFWERVLHPSEMRRA